MKIFPFSFSALFNFLKTPSIEVDTLIFVDHIVAWFEDAQRLDILRKDSNIIAVSIREKLEDGSYKIVNCLFDKTEGKIVHLKSKRSIAIIVAKELDAQTIEAFRDKDMIVLE